MTKLNTKPDKLVVTPARFAGPAGFEADRKLKELGYDIRRREFAPSQRRKAEALRAKLEKLTGLAIEVRERRILF